MVVEHLLLVEHFLETRIHGLHNVVDLVAELIICWRKSAVLQLELVTKGYPIVQQSVYLLLQLSIVEILRERGWRR